MRIKPRWVLSWNPRQVMSSIMRWRKDVAGVGKNGPFIAGRSCSVEGTSIIRAQTNSFNKSRNQPRSMPPAYHAQTSRGAGSFFGRGCVKTPKRAMNQAFWRVWDEALC